MNNTIVLNLTQEEAEIVTYMMASSNGNHKVNSGAKIVQSVYKKLLDLDVDWEEARNKWPMKHEYRCIAWEVVPLPCKYKVGDIVIVKITGATYPTYQQWADNNNVGLYKEGVMPFEGNKYEITSVSPHKESHYGMLYALDNRFIINERGIELVEGM